MTSATLYPIFTIGHSNHPADAFLAFLTKHGIDDVVDVRTSPFSRYIPHVNRGAIEATLDDAGIGYVFLGDDLGGRPDELDCYDDDGRVLYDKMAGTQTFEDGIKRVMRMADERRIVLMCSEREPLECHRGLLISQALMTRGVEVQHIMADGRVKSHDATVSELLPANGNFFIDRDTQIAEALARQSMKFGYQNDAFRR